MRRLVDRLNETGYQYYTLGEATISDQEWDAMYDQLTALERETGITLPDSPTIRVGSAPLTGFAEHRHIARLWSMDKAQSVGAVREWAQRAEKSCGRRRSRTERNSRRSRSWWSTSSTA